LVIAIGSVDPEAFAVTCKGVGPVVGFTVRAATGAPTLTVAVAVAVAPELSPTVTWTVNVPPAV
jgi:hypothetical protein